MSSTIGFNNINTTTSPLASAFAKMAVDSAQRDLIDGLTWNGDVNFSSLGTDFEAALLALDQKMVLPEQCRKTAKLDASTRALFDALVDKVVALVQSKSDHERAKAFGLVFRYLFYLRSVRTAGKKSRLLFYYLFERLHQIFPKTSCALLSMIPDFGYFGDLDALIEKMQAHPDVVSAAQNVYLDFLNADCNLIFGKNIGQVTNDEARVMNEKLKHMSVEQLRAFVGGKRLSLAAKWFKREGKKNSGHREDILVQVYFPNGGLRDLSKSSDSSAIGLAKRRLNYAQMVFRHVISALSQCLVVGETMMCETVPERRTWADIPMDSAPAVFLTKYRKALANELVKESIDETHAETGNRHPDNQDRVQARKNLLKALIDGKLKGAAQDIDRLSKIVFQYTSPTRCGYYGTDSRIISSSLSPTERQLIAAQWSDLVAKVKSEIVELIEKSRAEAAESGEIFLDPRNVIPVVDTSGSMSSANVQDKAIGLGILAAHLSSMPGCLISFSDKPEVFHLDMSGKHDVFDHFMTIINGPTGLNTNIDATYKVLLDLMVASGVKETDFALLFLTDGQFDSQVVIPDESKSSGSSYSGYGYHYGYHHESAMDRFQKTFIGRIEAAFRARGYNLPRTIFWNLNAHSPGFPSAANTRGVQLVSGYSQSLMIQVFTGDYKYELQADGSVKVSVSPWEAFLKAILHEDYDKVVAVVSEVGEGCFHHP